MSILIKGMEMPTEQTDVLIIAIQSDGSVFPVHIDGEGNPMIFQNEEMQNRAIPVPDHGRTIDGDVLCKVLQKNSEDEWNKTVAPFSWSYAYECVKDTVENMPTIIPADPAKEGER